MWFRSEEEGSRNNHWAVAVDQVAALRAAVGYCYSHLELVCALWTGNVSALVICNLTV